MAADFGTDFAGGPSLDPRMRLVGGTELMAMICCRRLSTPRGSLLSNPNAVTLDAREYMSREYDAGTESLLRANVTSALVDDKRIHTATVLPRFYPATRSCDLAIAGYGADGPFSLTIRVSELTVEALS